MPLKHPWSQMDCEFVYLISICMVYSYCGLAYPLCYLPAFLWCLPSGGILQAVLRISHQGGLPDHAARFHQCTKPLFLAIAFSQNSKFDFHKNIKRLLKDDFKVIIGTRFNPLYSLVLHGFLIVIMFPMLLLSHGVGTWVLTHLASFCSLPLWFVASLTLFIDIHNMVCPTSFSLVLQTCFEFVS